MPRLFRQPMLNGVLAAVFVCATATAVAACGDAPKPCPTKPTNGLAVAVGGRANSPSPSVATEVQDKITDAITNNKGITVIRVDGAPSIACALTFSSTAVNPAAKADDLRTFKQQAVGVITAVRARKAEANPLEALSRASAAAGAGGTVVLIDSGLQTVAPLNFLEPGLLDADPDAVAAELANRGYLPDLSQQTVILAAIGDTAPPQPALDERRRARLVRMWEKIVRRAGASAVTIVTTPNTNPAVDSVPHVTPVEVPPVDNIRIGCDTESVLSNDGKVGFRPDSTTFIDDDSARQALTEYATWLTQHSTAHAALVGTVAHYGSDDGDGGLSRARAERVRDVLLDLGVGADQVSARGDGWGPFPTKYAEPAAAFDQRNRRVVVKLTCG